MHTSLIHGCVTPTFRFFDRRRCNLCSLRATSTAESAQLDRGMFESVPK